MRDFIDYDRTHSIKTVQWAKNKSRMHGEKREQKRKYTNKTATQNINKRQKPAGFNSFIC